MDELLASILADVRGRETPRFGIRRAKDYLDTFGGTPAGVDDPSLWAEKLAEAESKLVYGDDDTALIDAKMLAKPLRKTPGAVLDFACVLTSTATDRDGDTLKSEGAELDPAMPLLWQHMPIQPIGKFVGELGRTEKNVTVQCAIADIPLGRDAATLVEFGALRISHGFRPTKAAPKKDGKGWLIEKFSVVEVSLVSVPSNPQAVITAFSREKLHTPLVKSWAKALADARPVAVTVPAEVDSIKAGRVLSKANHKKIKSAHKLLDEVISSNAHHETDDEDEETTEKAGKPACSCKCAACAKCMGMAKAASAPAMPLANVAPTTKAYVPIEGSWDWIRSKLQPTLSTYLMGKSLLGRYDYAWIDSMFPDSALVCVDSGPGSACWKLGWKMADGVPTWDGDPTPVEVVARMEEIKNHVAAIAQRRLDAMTARDVSEILYRQLLDGAAIGAAHADLLLTALTKSAAASREKAADCALESLLT